MTKWVLVLLITMLFALQTQLWFGEGSLAHKAELEALLEEKETKNQHLRQRNEDIAKQIIGLKNGLDSVEEKAREDLGMIKRGEVFYLVTDKQTEGAVNESSR
jgi:cell division protein FtsB|tara:strand:+ start:1066 stop:1374 length:309 start_codon:yes stop_codon:yes gene_type:complete